MIPVAITDLTPYRHFINGIYMEGCMRMLSPFDDFVALCIDSFIAEMNNPQSSEVRTEDYLSRAPITDDQYNAAKLGIVTVVNTIDSLLFMTLVNVDTRLYCIKYNYNATTMILTLYMDNRQP